MPGLENGRRTPAGAVRAALPEEAPEGPRDRRPAWRDQKPGPQPASGQGRSAAGPSSRHPALGRPSRRLGLTSARHPADTRAQSAEGLPPEEGYRQGSGDPPGLTG